MEWLQGFSGCQSHGRQQPGFRINRTIANKIKIPMVIQGRQSTETNTIRTGVLTRNFTCFRISLLAKFTSCSSSIVRTLCICMGLHCFFSCSIIPALPMLVTTRLPVPLSSPSPPGAKPSAGPAVVLEKHGQGCQQQEVRLYWHS